MPSKKRCCKPDSLTSRKLTVAVESLAQRDDDLARVVALFGRPPMWAREPGFPTLIHIILEQQVSLAAAKAAFDRLCNAVSPLTPQDFLTLDDAQLKAIGFSRQKTRYGRELARAVLNRSLDLDELAHLDDDAARARLKGVKGIGDWTVDIYLLMVLRRPDVFPKTDLALLTAAQRIKHLEAKPTPDELETMAEAWRPHRAAAARLLWHSYLSERTKGRRK